MTVNQSETENTAAIKPEKESAALVREISDKCIECGICVRQCAFLSRYGNPKKIADSLSAGMPVISVNPFACSLCSLCTAVCPVTIDPKQMFLTLRRELVSDEAVDFAKQKRLLDYEKRGTSKRYTFYGLPAGCKAVLFPGCALSGTRPKRVMQLYDLLKENYPNLGIVLDCCTKPSHDLGRSGYFDVMFSDLLQYLRIHNVDTVLTACPSCQAIFTQYSKDITTQSVYEILASDFQRSKPPVADKKVTIQDSCVARFEEQLQASVRRLVRASNLTLEEMKHYSKKTLCCGEGGGAYFVAPELAGSWADLRGREAGGRTIITYCAGCANFLNKVSPTLHILDLLFDPTAALAGKIRPAKAPITYLNRLLLKRKFKKRMTYNFSRERTFRGTADF